MVKKQASGNQLGWMEKHRWICILICFGWHGGKTRQSWRKNKTVMEELENLNWTRGLRRMGSVDEMAQFVELWDYTLNIHLTDQADQIKWN